MVQKNILALLLVTLLFNNFIHSAEPIDSTLFEDESLIRGLARELSEIRFNDRLLQTKNDQLIEVFEKALNKRGSFNYSFDTIIPINQIQSEDGLVKIFTWNTLNALGKFNQYGFLQYYSKDKDKVFTYRLNDKSEMYEKPQNENLTPDNWFGAVYYEILESKYQKSTLYTLIGWDGNDITSNKKVIESLVFTESGKAKFGKPVFLFGRKKVKRVVFEYSRMANMMITYDENLKMIVMDHLSPNNQIHQGNFKQYGPDFSYDALIYNNDYWEYIADIDFKREPKKKPFLKTLFGRKSE
ncbi:MAG: hypothetical protein JEZ09_16120 [Salinivirgaceae bacterium]|nr:hypothetical protein [Salinivirgaceae bacterium]